ncbi:class I SAM-dependent methyltransferase family protein [Candidatus Bathyarchaeota archaeon]|nr:MAG: class I SAM-dependent methyltransferase family protein [Candidatus Bathyarchaeota archaeon]
MRKRLRDKLSSALPFEELGKVYNSFDVIGDIAIIKINTLQYAEAIAKQIMASQRKIKTVLTPATSITGDFRVRELKHLAGENKTITRHKESGCTFKVDVEKCYFSPRLSHEHSRIAKLVQSGETVVNMFAVVGCFSIIIAKTANQSKVYSIDVNPAAIQCMDENVRINQVGGSVFPMLGDAKDIINSKLQGVADRVLMPLPEIALEYLPYALSALKQTGGWIHYYDFQHAPGIENHTEKTKLKVAEKLDCLGVNYVFVNSRVMRPTGPNWYQTVVDIKVEALPNKF